MLNNFNLYPYNIWLLYLSIVITIIALILLLSKLNTLKKSLFLYKDDISKIKNNVNEINKSVEIINNDIKSLTEKIKKVSPLIIMAYLFYKNYKESNEHGIKRINKSLVSTIRKTPIKNESKMVKAMRTI